MLALQSAFKAALIGLFSFVFQCQAATEPLARQILCVYQTDDHKASLHRGVETVLNHLGFIAVYRHCDDIYLRPSELKDIYGILIWTGEKQQRNAKAFVEWLIAQKKRDKKIILFNALPALFETKTGLPLPRPQYNSFLKLLGLELTKGAGKNPLVKSISVYDKKMMDFERKFEIRLEKLEGIKSISPDNSLHLSVHNRSLKDQSSDLVVTGDFGGIALSPALMYSDVLTSKKKWILNPFLFFEKALGIKGRPVPDVTTLNGRRIIYCHIDGDAFTGVCTFDQKVTCGEKLYEDILKKYLYPHTLSLVYCWFDPEVRHIQRLNDLGKGVLKMDRVSFTSEDQKLWYKQAIEIFAQPWVEPALHGYGHPFNWSKEMLGLTAVGRRFSLLDEFDRSLEIMDKDILLGKRKTKIFLWTGDCSPTREQLAHLEKLGLQNLNGGDPLLDSTSDSHFFLAPLTRQVGPYRQIYASACNEMIYTNEWTGPFYGFRNVVETFEHTDRERRLLPVNIYYHWYSAQYKASLKALVDIYEWAKKQPLVPIWVGRHIANVNGFFSTEIRTHEQGWSIKNNGKCRTIRFDNETRHVDTSPEHNVMGYTHDGNRVYVHLGPRQDSLIRFTSRVPKRAHIKWATCVVEDIKSTPKAFVAKVWGYGPAKLAFQSNGYVPETTKIAGITSQKDGFVASFHLNGHTTLTIPWTKKPF